MCTGSSKVRHFFTWHRLLLIGVIVAAKLYEDSFFNNAHFARVGGIPPEEVNQLEMEFLLLLDFQMLVDVKEYERLAKEIASRTLDE